MQVFATDLEAATCATSSAASVNSTNSLPNCVCSASWALTMAVLIASGVRLLFACFAASSKPFIIVSNSLDTTFDQSSSALRMFFLSCHCEHNEHRVSSYQREGRKEQGLRTISMMTSMNFASD